MQIKPWDEIQETLPPLSTLEKEKLKHSIEESGVQQPILVMPDGRIIDGHHRWEFGSSDVPYTVLDLPEYKAFELAIELNVARRQMSQEQEKEVRKKLKERRALLKETAQQIRAEGKTQAETAIELGVSQQAIDLWEDITITSNESDGNSYIPPDLRIKIPKDHNYIIHDRYTAGEFQSEIAADYKVSQAAISKILTRVNKEIEKAQELEDLIQKGKPLGLPDTMTLICGDFQEIGPTLEAESFDAIITDPPYPKVFLHLYENLAKQAARLLKPNGVLLAMAGQSYLPTIYSTMSKHLAYHWTICYLTPGGQSPISISNHKKVNTFWKPVLWFVKSEYTGKHVGDVLKSDRNDKRYHEWGQSERGMAELVDKLTEPGDLVLDPFLGGGTTAVVCHETSRPFVGIDIDESKIEITRGRLA